VHPLREWPEVKLRRLAQLCVSRSLPRGGVLVAEGEENSTEELYFLVRGNCKGQRTLELPGQGPHTIELCQLWPKDLCGELALMQRTAAVAEVSVVAETSIEVPAPRPSATSMTHNSHGHAHANVPAISPCPPPPSARPRAPPRARRCSPSPSATLTCCSTRASSARST
jgi:CRP-like cAMP-binding protein